MTGYNGPAVVISASSLGSVGQARRFATLVEDRAGSLDLVAVQGSVEGGRGDAFTTISVLASLAVSQRFVAVVSVDREPPYALARRSASLHHLSGGRASGLAITSDSASERILDAADLVRALWQTWPQDSVLADAASGVFADITRLRRVQASGAYRSRGPLTVPLAIDDLPVLVEWQPTGAVPAGGGGHFDISMTPGAGGIADLTGLDFDDLVEVLAQAPVEAAPSTGRAASLRARLGVGPSAGSNPARFAPAYGDF